MTDKDYPYVVEIIDTKDFLEYRTVTGLLETWLKENYNQMGGVRKLMDSRAVLRVSGYKFRSESDAMWFKIMFGEYTK